MKRHALFCQTVRRRDLPVTLWLLKGGLGTALGLLVGLAVLGTSAVPASAQAREPIKIGFLSELGLPAYAKLARHHVAGAEIAVEEMNAAGGVLGRPVRLIVRDSKGAPAEGVRQARDLIEREGVFALAHSGSSAVALAISEVAREKKVPFNGVVASVELTADAGHRYVLRTLPSNLSTMNARIAVRVAQERGWKRIYFIGADYAWPQRVYKDLKDHMAEAAPDMRMVGEQWPKLGATDYSPQISAIAGAAKDIDLLVQMFIGGDFITFNRQMSAFGLWGRVRSLGIGGILEAGALKDDLPKGFLSLDNYPFWLIDQPVNKAFVTKFRSKVGEWPNLFAPGGYETWVFAELIEKAGVVDREKLIDAIDGHEFKHSLRGPIVGRGCDNQYLASQWVGEVDDVRLPDGQTYRIIGPKSVEYTMKNFPRLFLSCEEVRKLRR